MKNYDILVIGAGSIGLATAYEFAKRGLKVAVIDKEASPGQGENKSAIGGIRATHSDPSKIAISLKSIELVSSMQKKHGYNVQWKQGGYFYPVYTKADEITLKELLKIQHQLEVNISWISPKETETLIPGINTKNLRGGTYSPGDGSASPMMLADAYYQLSRKAGAEYFFRESVVDMKCDRTKINKVVTNKNEYSAGMIINCAGAYAKDIAKMSGEDIPVFPESHEAGITQPVKSFFDPMIVDIRPVAESQNYYFYQNREGQIIFCITPLPPISGTDRDSTSAFLPQVVKRMIEIYPRLRNLYVRRTWRGLYPMTPDGFPLVGMSNKMENNLLAVGMCGQGFMLGPGLGKLMAEYYIDNEIKHKYVFDGLNPYRKFVAEEKLK
ncbi:MAG: FAD-binding oxidoreductase [Candidatus Neomarinimicrobiota bacterium]